MGLVSGEVQPRKREHCGQKPRGPLPLTFSLPWVSQRQTPTWVRVSTDPSKGTLADGILQCLRFCMCSGMIGKDTVFSPCTMHSCLYCVPKFSAQTFRKKKIFHVNFKFNYLYLETKLIVFKGIILHMDIIAC